MIASDMFHPGHPTETDLLRFCFMEIIRNDLKEVAAQWNMHRIRPSAGARCPAGIPDELFFLPQPGSVDCKIQCTVHNLPQFLIDQTARVSICEDEAYEQYLNYVCQLLHLNRPTSIEEGSRLYFSLRPHVIQT
jgi:hypothetical protein